jgi:hypothetical protein
MRLARILDPKRSVATRISKPALGLVGAFAAFCLAILPNTPQVISFEQGRSEQRASEQASSSAALHPFSTALAQPAIIASSVVHRANFQTSPRPAAVTSASFKPEPKASSPRKNQKSVSANPAVIVAARDSRPQEAASDTGIADNTFAAAAPNPLLQADQPPGARPDQNVQPTFSAVVFVHETQFVESDSSVVWRIQVWRVMLVTPMGERKARIPAAHST